MRRTIVFARKFDLYMMDAASYALALKKADDPNIKEIRVTKDGEEGFSYARHISGTEMQQQEQRNEEDGGGRGGAAARYAIRPDAFRRSRFTGPRIRSVSR